MYRILITIFPCLFICVSHAIAAKKIKANGEYIHKYAKTTFPVSIDEYTRTEIHAYDKEHKNISATYELRDTKVNVYVYPAGAADNHRFRGQYFNSLQAIVDANGYGAAVHQEYVQYKKGAYKVNGFQAYLEVYGTKSSGLRLYECGTWFLKIRISSHSLDTGEVTKLFDLFTQQFDPVALVTISPLSTKSVVNVAPAALKDSTLLGCTFASVLEKAKWALDNVDSLELQAGFPSLYLGMHISSLQAFVKHEEKHPDWARSETTEKYLKEIRSLIAAGYLDEYIMDEHGSVMIVPDGTEFDFEGYQRWRKTHPISYRMTGYILDVITYIPLNELRN